MSIEYSCKYIDAVRDFINTETEPTVTSDYQLANLEAIREINNDLREEADRFKNRIDELEEELETVTDQRDTLNRLISALYDEAQRV